MAAVHFTAPTRAQSGPSPSAAPAVRQALELLGRASADWRNGEPSVEGALHWPVSVNLARRALRQALEALEPARWPQEQHGTADDTRAGIAWFNSLAPAERRYWLEAADSAVPADAWAAFKSSSSQVHP